MKVLIITNSSSGLYQFRKDLIKEFNKRDYKVEVVTPSSGFINELENLGCELEFFNIDRRGKNLLSEFKLILKYKKIIKDKKPDKIISYTIKPNLYCGLITRFLGIDFYPNITGLGTAFQKDNLFKKFIIFIYKTSFKKANKVFFENNSNKELFIKEGISNNNNSICLNGAGVNLDEFEFSTLPPFETVNFIFIGRIMKEKGINELFEAIKIIKAKYKKTRFFILGGLEEDYKEYIDNMKRDGLLEYYGEVKDVREYIKFSHCILLPSYHEGMSNALLEGAAMGRSLITSNIPGCREAVKDNESGFLHRVKDSKDLANKIEKFILLSNEEKISFGKESRKIVEEKFDKKKVVQKTIENIFK
ncbi:glycosyltransferase family 4 protein [Clostridium perfringens]|uniref:glycosyltransferase family 4 protein n=1 Tax=Clostridium perfringens TaxID=1502 RepID=UPI001A2CA167|nr:glycosyltransferase family 4 protein [Clostridium perfringens]MDH5078693.1 N N'-diacetylbacillosaminyl-diphospho-undecaprenol alpha-13-N-acetylgalactosaminyltransferase [Clostridium perfringens]HAT4328043.1 glycosyltransferase family 4 protein [Clostridium perfringens]